MPCRPAISSHSLGRAWVHTLESKLEQASRYGLDIELFYEDLIYYAHSLPSTTTNPLNGQPTPASLLTAAHSLHTLCTTHNITVVSLQPFMHYEALTNRTHHAQRVTEMSLWIQLALALHTPIIAIPSTFLPPSQTSPSKPLIASDLRILADMGAPHGIKFIYEALCWGTHTSTWEDSYEIVQLVDRDNFGLCLDTFNIAGKIYADPASVTGKVEGAEEAVEESMTRLREIDVKKLFLVQVVDAERLEDGPLRVGHRFYEEGQAARMSWSRNCRLFYGEGERGGYLPVDKILRVILGDLGFDGVVSAELFNRSLMDEGSQVPEEHARRAKESFGKIWEEFGGLRRVKSRGGSFVGERAQL